MMLVHLSAHAVPGKYPLATTDGCWRLWRRLRRAIKRVLAAYLMPNHFHLIAWVRSPDELRLRIGQILAGFTKSYGGGAMWLSVSTPTVIGDPGKLARDLRYVLLNGTRAHFMADPACHIWSTYRDVIGATLDPWVDVRELADALGRHEDGFLEWFQAYVTGDTSVQVAGTPLPAPAPPRDGAGTPLELVAAAAAATAATALCPDRKRALLERHAFVLLARHQGWSDLAAIAGHSGMSVQTARRLSRQGHDALLRVAALYLGDSRLLAPPTFRRAA